MTVWWRAREQDNHNVMMNINSYLLFTEALLVPYNGRVPHVDKGSTTRVSPCA